MKVKSCNVCSSCVIAVQVFNPCHYHREIARINVCMETEIGLAFIETNDSVYFETFCRGKISYVFQ